MTNDRAVRAAFRDLYLISGRPGSQAILDEHVNASQSRHVSRYIPAQWRGLEPHQGTSNRKASSDRRDDHRDGAGD